MKKIISQISLILIMVIGFSAVLMPNAYASLAGINCVSSVNEGETFSVSLIYPSGYEITAAQADVTVTYSDNSTQTDKIVYTVDKDLNLTVDTPAKFTAKVAGTAKISATNILMAKSDGTVVENNGTKTATLTVVAKQTNTGSSNTGNSGSSSSNSGSSSNAGSTGSSSSTGNVGSSTPSTPTTTPSTPTTTTPKFTDVNETVYTTTRCNLRESYSTSSNKIATVDAETKLTRKGVGDNGWSKCEYNGKTVYVSTQYLTTTAPKTDEDEKDEKEPEEVKFKDTKENLYANQNCNLRASWSTDSEKVGYLTKGQAVERTGYADNGWSRILYNGKTVYVASRLLSVEKPEEDEEKVENTVKNEVVNETVVDSTIINEEVEKLTEEEMLNIIKEEVGVLPEVGTNVANVAYVIVTMMVLCGLACGIIYIKKIK